MTNLLRNREVCVYFLCVALLGAAGSIGAFLLGGAPAGAAALLAALLTTLCAAAFTHARYREIARLSAQLSRIAVGDYCADLREYGEGELSILYDELHKVTRTLAHQAEALRKDKHWLADTMADISHQLKTPLTSVAMFADLLEDPALPPQKRGEFLSGIHAGTERIRWLVLSLLKLSQLDADAVVFKQEPVVVEALVDSALAPLRLTIEQKEQALSLQVESGAAITGDRAWLAEAVGNLLKNSVEHTPPGGKIFVRARVNPLYTLLEVGDSGPGIAREDIPHIFDRFYRGKNAAPDSIGIGLALCKSIVLRHGGTIEVHSGSEPGARFSIKFYNTVI